MRNVIAVLLILAVAVGWFSTYGPRETVDGSGIGPGDDRMGESPLVVSGPGAGIVDVAQGEETQEKTGQAPSEGGAAKTQDGAETPEEEKTMGDATLILVGCAVGVTAVLIGMFTGPVVARMWQKIRNN